METPGTYEVAVPDVEIMIAKNDVYEWRGKALVFKKRLTNFDIEKLSYGLTEFLQGHQLMFTDYWHELDKMGIDWTQFIPESIAEKTAGNWFRMGTRFTPELRTGHKHLMASHYIAASAFKLPEEAAVEIITAAEAGKWSVKAVEEAVKLIMGKPEKVKKPKLIQCKHCDNWIADIEDLGCPWCMLSVAEKRIEGLREVLTKILGLMAETPEDYVLQVSIMADTALAEV